MIIKSANGAVRLNAAVGDILNDIDVTGLRLLALNVVFTEFVASFLTNLECVSFTLFSSEACSWESTPLLTHTVDSV